jgi:hypothetical protein
VWEELEGREEKAEVVVWVVRVELKDLVEWEELVDRVTRVGSEDLVEWEELVERKELVVLGWDELVLEWEEQVQWDGLVLEWGEPMEHLAMREMKNQKACPTFSKVRLKPLS